MFAQEPDEVTNAAKEGIFPASQKFLNAAKGVSETTSDGTVQQEVIAAAMNTGQAISELLEVGKRDRQDEATFPLLEEASSNGTYKEWLLKLHIYQLGIKAVQEG